jgi:hypothetical protein
VKTFCSPPQSREGELVASAMSACELGRTHLASSRLPVRGEHACHELRYGSKRKSSGRAIKEISDVLIRIGGGREEDSFQKQGAPSKPVSNASPPSQTRDHGPHSDKSELSRDQGTALTCVPACELLNGSW